MLRYYLKTPPLKKILQFQNRTCFIIKNTKSNHSLTNDWWKNKKSTSKENPNLFLKISPLNKTQDWQKTAKLLQKNFKPEIKPMIKNLQDKHYQLENQQPKGAKIAASIR